MSQLRKSKEVFDQRVPHCVKSLKMTNGIPLRADWDPGSSPSLEGRPPRGRGTPLLSHQEVPGAEEPSSPERREGEIARNRRRSGSLKQEIRFPPYPGKVQTPEGWTFAAVLACTRGSRGRRLSLPRAPGRAPGTRSLLGSGRDLARPRTRRWVSRAWW